jgi:hypothetical protein
MVCDSSSFADMTGSYVFTALRLMGVMGVMVIGVPSMFIFSTSLADSYSELFEDDSEAESSSASSACAPVSMEGRTDVDVGRLRLVKRSLAWRSIVADNSSSSSELGIFF